MVYTDSQKRRDTKKKWKRRADDAMLKWREIQGIYSELSLREYVDIRERENTLSCYSLLMSSYGNIERCYRWMLENLSGG